MTSFSKSDMHKEILILKEKIDNLKENCRKSDISQLKYKLKIIKSKYNKCYNGNIDASNQYKISHEITQTLTTKELIDIMESKLEAADTTEKPKIEKKLKYEEETPLIATSEKSAKLASLGCSTSGKFHSKKNQKYMWNFLSFCCQKKIYV